MLTKGVVLEMRVRDRREGVDSVLLKPPEERPEAPVVRDGGLGGQVVRGDDGLLEPFEQVEELIGGGGGDGYCAHG